MRKFTDSMNQNEMKQVTALRNIAYKLSNSGNQIRKLEATKSNEKKKTKTMLLQARERTLYDRAWCCSRPNDCSNVDCSSAKTVLDERLRSNV